MQRNNNYSIDSTRRLSTSTKPQNTNRIYTAWQMLAFFVTLLFPIGFLVNLCYGPRSLYVVFNIIRVVCFCGIIGSPFLVIWLQSVLPSSWAWLPWFCNPLLFALYCGNTLKITGAKADRRFYDFGIPHNQFGPYTVSRSYMFSFVTASIKAIPAETDAKPGDQAATKILSVSSEAGPKLASEATKTFTEEAVTATNWSYVVLGAGAVAIGGSQIYQVSKGNALAQELIKQGQYELAVKVWDSSCNKTLMSLFPKR